jgi:hypothetical protein
MLRHHASLGELLSILIILKLQTYFIKENPEAQHKTGKLRGASICLEEKKKQQQQQGYNTM